MSVDWLLGIECTRAGYFFDSMVLSMREVLLCLLNPFHRLAARRRMRAANAWCMAAVLRGMALSTNQGSKAVSDELWGPSAASFAATSAAMLPWIPQCPGIHQKVSPHPLSSVSESI
jgi:hypothetical protein